MRIEMASVVIPVNGRDEGKRFLVIGAEEEYSLLADGKNRRAEKPKRKKNKHLRLEGKIDGKAAEKLDGGGKLTNNEIRRALGEYASAEGGGMSVG